MRHKASVRTLVAWTITLLFFGGLLPAANASHPEGGASARATDLEPENNNPNSAPELVNDEVIEGSLRMTATNDYFDIYHTTVAKGKVINASLQMVDLCATEPWRINFHLYFAINVQGQLTAIYWSETEKKWENLIFMQMASENPLDIWVVVQINLTQQGGVNSDPGRYTLSVTVADPTPYSGGTATGYLDSRGPLAERYYKLTGTIPDDKVAFARLQCPVNGDFDLFVYNTWPRYTHQNLGSFWQQNASWTNASMGNMEEVRVGGSESTCTYYIRVRGWDGAGTYTLTVDTTGSAIDNNNINTKATYVNDNYPHEDFVDQGLDGFDWWTVNARAGKPIPDIFFIETANAPNNLFCMYIYDKNLVLKSSKYNTKTGGWPNFDPQNLNEIMNNIEIKNTTVGYDGPIYVLIQAITHFYGQGEGAAFIPSKTKYKLTFTLPNTPPQYLGGLPEVTLDEDTVHESLVLANYFKDEDGDTLSYQAIGTSYRTHPKVDNVTGLVTFTPEANWAGQEVVRFRCIDSGPGNKWAECNATVIVNPVNDPPYSTKSIEDMTIREGDTAYTPDLSTIFADIDNLLVDLKYNLKVLSQNTHPPGSNLPIQFIPSERTFRLGPASLFYGTYNIQVTCTDGVTATVPAAVNFSLAVTHVNHKPTLKENIADPMDLTIREHEKDSHLNVADLFTDPDTPEEYANDALNYTITGAQKLLVDIDEEGYIIINTGKEQYKPGERYEEKLLVTAKDRLGLKATLNITVLVEAVNDPPRIATWSPDEIDFELGEGKRQRFSVTAMDDDSLTLTYSWYLNGKKQNSAKGLFFDFDTDYEMGDSVYTVKVDIYDGTTVVSHEWNVTVLEVNRKPIGSISTPLNMTAFDSGTLVIFTATGTDPDQKDTLTFIWRDKNGVELGRGDSFATDKLPPGTQTVTLEITDNKDSIFTNVTIVVRPPPEPQKSDLLAGMGGGMGVALIGIIIIVAVAGVVAAFIMKRKAPPPPPPEPPMQMYYNPQQTQVLTDGQAPADQGYGPPRY